MLSMSQLHGFNAGGEHDPYWNNVVSFWDMRSLDDLKTSTDWARNLGSEVLANGYAYCDVTVDNAQGWYNEENIALGTEYALEFFVTITNAGLFTSTTLGLFQLAAEAGRSDCTVSITAEIDGSGDLGRIIFNSGYSSFNLSYDTTYHMAVVRGGGYKKLYVNGTLAVSVVDTDTLAFTTSYMNFGRYGGFSLSLKQTEFSWYRLTNAERYTGDFSVPSTPLPSQ